MNLITEVPRSPEWPECRKNFLVHNPKCVACGGVLHLQVHHKQPFHLFPTLELDPKNLITLCETPSHNCHFSFGHLLDWKLYNENVEQLVAMYADCFLHHRKSA